MQCAAYDIKMLLDSLAELGYANIFGVSFENRKDV